MVVPPASPFTESWEVSGAWPVMKQVESGLGEWSTRGAEPVGATGGGSSCSIPDGPAGPRPTVLALAIRVTGSALPFSTGLPSTQPPWTPGGVNTIQPEALAIGSQVCAGSRAKSSVVQAGPTSRAST